MMKHAKEMGLVVVVASALVAVFFCIYISPGRDTNTSRSSSSTKEKRFVKQRRQISALSTSSNKASPKNVLNSKITQSNSNSQVLQYDKNIDFAANLERLKLFCEGNRDNRELTRLVDAFVKSATSCSKNKFDVIRSALRPTNGHPLYKNILLACLMCADGASEEKANVVWGISLNLEENVSVRRTATYLIGEIGANQKRPDEYRRLLDDSDDQVVIFALTSKNRNACLDQAGFDIIKNNLLKSPNVNLQVAAVNAIGTTSFSEAQGVLLAIIEKSKTSSEDSFSHQSLCKRAAITHLETGNMTTRHLVEAIASDSSEDPGVRAKAIRKLVPGQFPHGAEILHTLLGVVNEDNLVALRAVVETLLLDPSQDNIARVEKKIGAISDNKIKRLFIQKLENAIHKEGRL